MRSVDVCGDQGIESEFLDWNHEFGKFSLIGFDHVCMGPTNLLELILQIIDHFVFGALDLFDGFGNSSNSSSIDMSSLKHFIQL